VAPELVNKGTQFRRKTGRVQKQKPTNTNGRGMKKLRQAHTHKGLYFKPLRLREMKKKKSVGGSGCGDRYGRDLQNNTQHPRKIKNHEKPWAKKERAQEKTKKHRIRKVQQFWAQKEETLSYKGQKKKGGTNGKVRTEKGKT